MDQKRALTQSCLWVELTSKCRSVGTLAARTWQQGLASRRGCMPERCAKTPTSSFSLRSLSTAWMWTPNTDTRSPWLAARSGDVPGRNPRGRQEIEVRRDRRRSPLTRRVRGHSAEFRDEPRVLTHSRLARPPTAPSRPSRSNSRSRCGRSPWRVCQRPVQEVSSGGGPGWIPWRSCRQSR